MNPADVQESSGLARGRSAIWTHDDGDAPHLVAISPDGTTLLRHELDADIQDAEEIVARSGTLYLGDIGNNQAERERIRILALREPRRNDTVARVKKTYVLTYPADPFDAEAFVLQGSRGLLFTKELQDGRSTAYEFRLAGKEQTLRRSFSLAVTATVRGAALARDGNRLAILTEAGASLFRLGRRTTEDQTLEPELFVPFAYENMEGCTFTADGLLVSAEDGSLFLFTDDAFRDR